MEVTITEGAQLLGVSTGIQRRHNIFNWFLVVVLRSVGLLNPICSCINLNSIRCDADGVDPAGKPGLEASSDAEEEEHGGAKKRGGKKGTRAPYLESMQRNLHSFIPLTSEGTYLLVSASFPFLSMCLCLLTVEQTC